MIIRHLRIENFRGIRELDWHLHGRILCLVGPNDSTKTTILDAVELALSSRSNLPIIDTDFHGSDVTSPIVIEATVGEVPIELLADDKFGLYLRGYSGEATRIDDDPVDGCDPVLTIRFTIDQELEPTWSVIKSSHDDPKPISWKDRERLGIARLGGDVERHLTWGRGSALFRMTEDASTTGRTFLEIARTAKRLVADADLENLQTASDNASKSAKRMGVSFQALQPGLDALGISFGNSVLSLHEGSIPVRLCGLGTRRLAALGIQQSGVGQQSALLIDEIEHGLEPHRVRHLVRCLSSDLSGLARTAGQVLFSTHSPTSIIELPVDSLRFVRSQNGQTIVSEVSPSSIASLQSIARSHSHAFLARQLLICEGATEVGLFRGLEMFWASQMEGVYPAHLAAIAVDGKGRTIAPVIAMEFKRIGYDTAVLGDSDEPIEPDENVLRDAGIPVFVWAGMMATEQRLAVDLPMAQLQELVDFRVADESKDSLLGQVGHFAKCNLSAMNPLIADWINTGACTELSIRQAVGFAAKKHGWFKNVSAGIRLGEIVGSALPSISATPTGKLLGELMKWIYE